MKRRQARGDGTLGRRAVGGGFAWLFACVLLDGLLGRLLELCLVVCFKLQVEPIRNIKKGDFSPAESSFRSARTRTRESQIRENSNFEDRCPMATDLNSKTREIQKSNHLRNYR
jgi:hypothetical protein